MSLVPLIRLLELSLTRMLGLSHIRISFFLNEDGHPRPALRASHRVRINVLLTSFQPA